MKKVGLFLIGAIAAIILLSQLGPLFGLVISSVLLYVVFKQYIKADNKKGKVAWGIIGVIMLLITASNLPAILGLVAAYVLYLVYKKWNGPTNKKYYTNDDPFTNFEKTWSELKKN